MSARLIGSRFRSGLVGCVVTIPVVAAAGALISTSASGCKSWSREKDEVRAGLIDAGGPDATMATEDMIERGRYLVAVGACNDCHTPFKLGANGPEPDMSRMLSGHPEGLDVPKPPTPVDNYWIVSFGATNTAYAGPWGISYAANLTPDQLTGMGIWSEEMFIRAMREGKHMGTSRPIVPPMPWPSYAQMTDEDLKSVFAYLKSIPAISNRVPTYFAPGDEPADDYSLGEG